MKRLRYLLFSVLMMAAFTVKAQEKSIAECSYWIDLHSADAQPLGLSGDRLDISTLVPGLHTFTMRVKDNEGLWSSAVTKYFFIPSPTDVEQKATAIVAREYWIDGKIASRAALGESTATVSLLGLPPGVHYYTMRVQDDLSMWSSPLTQYFLIPFPEDVTPEEVTIARYMYWFDDNIDGFLTADADGATGTVPIDVSGLATGEHTISWRVGDSKGAWSEEVRGSVFRYTVPASGIGTFSAAGNMALPEGLSAHYTTVYNDNYSTIHVEDIEGSVIPAYTGVLLMGEPGISYILLSADEEAPTVEGNTLVAVVDATHVAQTDGEYTNFMMKGGRFIKIGDAAETSKMPAHRAYLQLPTGALTVESGTNGITLAWDDETTGISTVTDDSKHESIFYDLQGRRVTIPQRGIYITNGKKVVVK